MVGPKQLKSQFFYNAALACPKKKLQPTLFKLLYLIFLTKLMVVILLVLTSTTREQIPSSFWLDYFKKTIFFVMVGFAIYLSHTFLQNEFKHMIMAVVALRRGVNFLPLKRAESARYWLEH